MLRAAASVLGRGRRQFPDLPHPLERHAGRARARQHAHDQGRAPAGIAASYPRHSGHLKASASEETMSKQFSYDQGVSGFDQTFGLPMRQFVPTLLRLARLAPGQQVLDVATGSGISAGAALDAVGPSGHVIAADIEPSMLDEAKKRLGSYPNVSFAVEDSQALTFPDASFDAIVCCMALHIFPDRVRALSGFHRVLRGGGCVAV